MKKCRDCKKVKPVKDFYKTKAALDGLFHICKECKKLATKANYRKNRKSILAYDKRREQNSQRKTNKAKYQAKHRKTHPLRYKARNAVNNALRDGRIEKAACACGSKKVQAHYQDYRKPLDVLWMCFACHRQEHGQEIEITS